MTTKKALTKLFRAEGRQLRQHFEEHGWNINPSIGQLIYDEFGIDPHVEILNQLPEGIRLGVCINRRGHWFVGFKWDKGYNYAVYDAKLDKIKLCLPGEQLWKKWDNPNRYVQLGIV